MSVLYAMKGLIINNWKLSPSRRRTRCMYRIIRDYDIKKSTASIYYNDALKQIKKEGIETYKDRTIYLSMNPGGNIIEEHMKEVNDTIHYVKSLEPDPELGLGPATHLYKQLIMAGKYIR